MPMTPELAKLLEGEDFHEQVENYLTREGCTTVGLFRSWVDEQKEWNDLLKGDTFDSVARRHIAHIKTCWAEACQRQGSMKPAENSDGLLQTGLTKDSTCPLLLQTGLTKDSTCPLDDRADDLMDCSIEDESLPCELPLDDANVGADESTSGANDQSSPLTTSVSQENAQHLQRVLQRVEQCQRAVLGLKDEVESFKDSLNSARLQDADGQLQQQVTSVLKRAGKLGQQLDQDLLGLDDLTDLLPDDRTSKKEAVKKINSLLEELDACKTIVVKVQSALRKAREAQLQRLLQRVEQTQRAVPDLKAEVASLNSAPLQDADGKLEQQVTSVLKRARDLGEDLVEDLLGLDKLTGLLPDDRTSKKEAVERINSLSDEIDACKTVVGKVQTALRNASEAQRVQRTMQTSEPPLVSASARRFDSQAIAPPSDKIWPDMQVSVDFETGQQRGGYIVSAAIPSLRRDSIDIKRDERARELTVSGVCQPKPHEVKQMHQYVVGKIERLVSGHPQRLSEITAHGNDVALQFYREQGAGKFGRFSETFRLPMDVDMGRISAQFNDGVISISLMTDPSCSRHRRYPHSARSGLSMFDLLMSDMLR